MWVQKGMENNPHFLSIDAEKGFGFSNKHGGNIWLLLVPEKVNYSGCIKTTYGGSAIFWSRKCDATVTAILLSKVDISEHKIRVEKKIIK